MKLLFLMDPVEAVDVTKDTTFAFMMEAQSQGLESWYCGARNLTFRDGGIRVHAAPIRVKPVQGEHFELGDFHWHAAEDFACIFMRKDPPFDSDFFYTTHLLSLVDESRTLVFNRASGLREASEKLFILRFPDLIAETMVSASRDGILDFRDRVGGDIVVKPLDGCGGAGIFRLGPNDLNTRSILETMTEEGRRPIMAQRFLPASREGDMRLLYLEGKPLGAIRRVPRADDLRSNIHVGGTVEAVEIGEREHEICERLAPELDRLGIWFAGLDVIGGFLTEVNVTSPTGVQEADRLAERNHSKPVIEMVVRRCRELGR